MKIRVEGLRFSYGATPVLCGIDLEEIPSGRVTAIIGPNAAGKSTLFKCIAGLLRPEGRVLLDDQTPEAIGRAAYRRLVSYLPQEYPSTAALTVFEAVLLARQRSASWFVADADLARASAVLQELGLQDLSLRHLHELSGGQRQLVAVAQALAREPRALLLDEPTSSLDLQRQLELLAVVRSLAHDRGVTVAIALHDLNLAARYADLLVVLHSGRVRAAGSAERVLTEPLLRDVYGVEARVQSDETGVPVVTALRSVRDRIDTPFESGDAGIPAGAFGTHVLEPTEIGDRIANGND
ncbi:MAG: ABC transporter ATP-binding protein [Chloroflexi bacterium]|nr:ABC transporter ATP-binding protein [Chloroflexota bacterium]